MMFNLNINSKTNLKAKEPMRKSSSVIAFKSLPLEQIDFNPSEFQVGESKIDRLPYRAIPRRNSVCILPRVQKGSTPKQQKQLELSLVIKINKKLCKQNADLKKQIELYKKISYNNTSRGRISDLEQSLKQQINLQQIVAQKINRTKCSSRGTSDNQTGLYSSKQISYNHQFQSINQMYLNFVKKSITPTLAYFNDQLAKFFAEIQETFLKLKFLFESLIQNHQPKHPSIYSKCQNLLESINDICQTKIQKQKASQYPGLAEKGKSRSKVERQVTRQKNTEKEEVLQLMSPEQIIERFQKYIQKVLKSQRIVKSLKSSLIVRKFTKKLSEV